MSRIARVWNGTEWVVISQSIVNPYPTQTGNNGKFLQTDGLTASWQNVDFSNYVSKSGGDTITASSASVIPLTIKGAASQTSDLFSILNNSNNEKFSIDHDGYLTNRGIGSLIWAEGSLNATTFTNVETSPTRITLLSQTDPLVYSRMYFEDDSVVLELKNILTQNWDSTGFKITSDSSSVVPLTIVGASSQSANLQIWKNNSGTNVATMSADGALTIGSLSASSITISGNLTVNGTTTTVNSTTITVDDPTITLGGDTAPVANDNKDRGIEFRYFDNQARIGFMGYDDSTGKFIFLKDATNTSEIFTGTKATIDANISGNNINDGTVSATYIDSAIARVASPSFTGTPTAPTAPPGTNSTRIATTEFVQKALEITQLDTFTFDGRTTRFKPTYLGSPVNVDHPLRLLLNINGIMQIIAEKPSTVWLSGLASVGYYIDDQGYVVLPEPPEPGSYFEARLFPGVDLQKRPEVYPFRAIDIYLGD